MFGKCTKYGKTSMSPFFSQRTCAHPISKGYCAANETSKALGQSQHASDFKNMTIKKGPNLKDDNY